MGTATLDSYCNFTTAALIHLVVLCLSQQANVLFLPLRIQLSSQQRQQCAEGGRWALAAAAASHMR